MAKTPMYFVVKVDVDGEVTAQQLPEESARCPDCGSFEFMTLRTKCIGPAHEVGDRSMGLTLTRRLKRPRMETADG